jgi:hypothetical protein
VELCIASYNTRRATELTIRSAVRRAGMPFHLVVGDGGSVDGSVRMLERFADSGLLTLELAPSGSSHAEWLDHWYATCAGRYLVFSDSDVYYRRSGWLTDMVEAARDSGAALVAGRIQPNWSERPRFADGSQRRLPGARPEPCLLLIDMHQLRGVVDSSFAWHEEPLPDRPGQKLTLDVGGAFMRAVQEAGLRCIEMPIDFQRKYRHWGGLTWKRVSSDGLALKIRSRQFAKASLVTGLLVAERVADRAARRRTRGRSNDRSSSSLDTTGSTPEP